MSNRCRHPGLVLGILAFLAPLLLGARPALAQTKPAPTAPDRPERPTRTAPAPRDGGESPATHHQRGRRQFSDRQYEAAIASYRRAYELKADPSYLLDIAEAYRALEMPERALFFYQRYLSTHPNPPNRPEVEAEVSRLQPLVSAVAAPAPPSPLPPMTSGAVPARDSASSASADLDLGLNTRASLLEEEKRPILARWWFWTAIGALAAAGATVAILSASRGEEEIPPSKLGNAKLF